ncbi:MAG: GPW/gp25 family protein [Chloroflexales bacterium]|nr:GPW/gp25 family protein [Chloroflexales bacterium]
MEPEQSPFLGVGWAFPLALDQRGQVVAASYESLVRQSIWLILATAPGERMMRPDFGCGLHRLLFRSDTAAVAGIAASEVRQALVRWEPRIELLDVRAAPDPAQPSYLLIVVDYLVRRTNSRFNLVYPFYLER